MVENNSTDNIYDEISDEIVKSEQFDIYFTLLKNEILGSVNQFPQEFEFSKVKFLLECASILACSSNDEHKQIAYSIVILIYNQNNEEYEQLKFLVEAVLIRLGNFPAQILLNRHGVTFNKNLHSELPPFLEFELSTKKTTNKISVNGNEVFLTDFQKTLFDKLNQGKDYSFAAPTSAGKSFLLSLFVLVQLKLGHNSRVIYVVPTKALINQVKNDFKENLKSFDLTVPVVSSTVNFDFDDLKNEMMNSPMYILILTQERFSYLLGREDVNLDLDILIIDEAQKINDGSRGVILERVIVNAVKKYPDLKIVFSSPLASNPEFFKKFKGQIETGKTNYSPVHQNVLFINTSKKKDFLTLLFDSNPCSIIKESELLKKAPKSDKAKTAYFTFHLGKNFTNIVYANGAADSEDLAKELCKYLDDVTHPKIEEFIKFIKENIHADYSLVDCLRKGVAFHYSTMPREIKEKIEELFSIDEVPITYLCCTSTLLEGMNLPARNVFINKPTKGQRNKMQKFDFWNLAGRAGRLLKDFYGNIYCIDIDLWSPESYKPEKSLENYKIESATEGSLVNKTQDLSKYLTDLAQNFPLKERELLEEASSTFIANYIENSTNTVGSLLRSRNIDIQSPFLINKIEQSIDEIAKKNNVPIYVLKKNPGIDPRLQNNLLTHFSSQFYITFLPKYPAPSREFYQSLLSIYDVIDKVFFNGVEAKIIGRYAVISSQWINEDMLGQLIQGQIDYEKKEDKFKNVNSCVRKVVGEIDSVVTYKYAKYLKCYNDILEFHLLQLKIALVPINLSAYLELGAHYKTTLSLMSFGFSRTTSVRLRKQINNINLDRQECKRWLDNNYASIKNNLPSICQEDVERNY